MHTQYNNTHTVQQCIHSTTMHTQYSKAHTVQQYTHSTAIHTVQQCTHSTAIWNTAVHKYINAFLYAVFTVHLECNCVKNDPLDAQFILSIFRQPLHISVVSRPIIRRYKRMYTAIGTSCSSRWLSVVLVGLDSNLYPHSWKRALSFEGKFKPSSLLVSRWTHKEKRSWDRPRLQ